MKQPFSHYFILTESHDNCCFPIALSVLTGINFYIVLDEFRKFGWREDYGILLKNGLDAARSLGVVLTELYNPLDDAEHKSANEVLRQHPLVDNYILFTFCHVSPVVSGIDLDYYYRFLFSKCFGMYRVEVIRLLSANSHKQEN